MMAFSFILRSLTGATEGVGLICSTARYAALLRTGADEIDRRVASPATWRAIEVQLQPICESKPFGAEGSVARLLLSEDVRKATMVQHLSFQDVDRDLPLERLREALDWHLLTSRPLTSTAR